MTTAVHEKVHIKQRTVTRALYYMHTYYWLHERRTSLAPINQITIQFFRRNFVIVIWLLSSLKTYEKRACFFHCDQIPTD